MNEIIELRNRLTFRIAQAFRAKEGVRKIDSAIDDLLTEVISAKDQRIKRLEEALLRVISMCDQYPDNWDITKVADEALQQDKDLGQ